MKVRQGAALGVAPGHCAPPNAAQAHLGLSSSAPWARLECRVAACVPRHPQIPTNGISEIGSLPLIHGKTITLLVNPTTKAPQPGSWRVRRFQNGKHPDRVPCCGCMGNVSGRLPLTLSQRLIILLPRSGRRKECSVVREAFNIISRNLWCRPVLRSSRRSRQCENAGSHHSRSITMTSGKTKRRTSAGYSLPFYPSFATSRTPTPMSFPISIPHTIMAHKVPAMMNSPGV